MTTAVRSRRSINATGAVFGAVLLAVSTAACGAGTDTGSTAAAGGLKSILFVSPLPNNPQWKLIGECMQKEADARAIPLTINGPTGQDVDTNFMLARVQQGISSEVGAIATFPVSAPQFSPVLQQAKDKGILVATLFGGGSTDIQDTEIGADYVEAATKAVEAIAKRPGQQNVGILVTSAARPASTWSDAFIAAAEKTDNVTVVATQYDEGATSKDIDIAANMMTANPELNMFATNLGAATAGLSSAIKQADKVGQVFITANGSASGGVEGIEDGTVYTFMAQDLCSAGKAVTDAFADLHAGKTVAKDIPVGVRFVFKDDYQDILAQGWL